MANNDFPKARLVLGLLKRLERGEGLTIAEVAEAGKIKGKPVTEKTAKEYINLLAEFRDLVEVEDAGVTSWRLKTPPGQRRGLDDAVAVTFAQVALRSFHGTSVHKSLEALAAPIHQSVNDTDFSVLRQVGQIYRRLLKPEAPPQRATVLDALIRALHGHRRCRITYTNLEGKEGSRDIEPLSLFEHQDIVYVFATNCTDGRPKSFDVDGIGSVTVLDATFRPPVLAADPADLMRSAVGIYIVPQQPVEEVVLLARNGPAVQFRRRKLHPSQICELLGDGLIRLRLQVQVTPDFVGLLLGFLPHVRPVTPTALVEQFEARRMGAQPE